VCTARIAHSARLRGRCAVIVPKHGHTAVLRNQLKRRTREIMREIVLPYSGSFDIVIRMRREAYEAQATSIKADFLRVQQALVLVGQG